MVLVLSSASSSPPPPPREGCVDAAGEHRGRASRELPSGFPAASGDAHGGHGVPRSVMESVRRGDLEGPHPVREQEAFGFHRRREAEQQPAVVCCERRGKASLVEPALEIDLMYLHRAESSSRA